MKLVLLRHGESQWNLENRFTGWTDIALTKAGENEAAYSGEQLRRNNIKIKTVYTSLLDRAMQTADIVTSIINFPQKDIQYDWRLNERHYGALQGLNKSETAMKYGEEQVQIWRRSYDVPPPPLSKNDKRNPKFSEKFKNITGNLPVGESLMHVIDRLKPFWDEYVNDVLKTGDSHLLVAHSNSLRGIVKILDRLSEDEIVSVNIPTGVPLVYTLDKELRVLNKEYLISKKELEAKEESIINQGKAK